MMDAINSAYRRCYCPQCKGRLVSRWTRDRHSDRTQHRPGADERICSCSRHPLGKIVHRTTHFRHRKEDEDNGTTPSVTLDIEDVPALMPDTEDPTIVQAHIHHLDRIRGALELLYTLEDDEELEGDLAALDSPEEDPIESEIEQDDAAANEPKISAENTTDSLPTDLDRLIDWIYLLEGIPRRKRQEMVKFYATHFKIKSPTIWRVEEKLRALTGIKPIWYDCCINSCFAFTGQYAKASYCPHKDCGEPRWRDQVGSEEPRARKRWLYIPLKERLIHQYKESPYAGELSTYRAGFDESRSGRGFTDIFDGNLYKDLKERGFFL